MISHKAKVDSAMRLWGYGCVPVWCYIANGGLWGHRSRLRLLLSDLRVLVDRLHCVRSMYLTYLGQRFLRMKLYYAMLCYVMIT